MIYRIRLTALMVCIGVSMAGCRSHDLGTPVANSGERGRYHIVQRGDTLYSIAWRYGLDYGQLAAANGIAPPYTIYVNQKIRLRGGAEPRKEKKDGPPRNAVARRPPETTIARSVEGKGDVSWRWPLEGEIIEPFSLRGAINKGIDIRGKSGDPVRSAADGVVVYAGGGLRGYGKLVIVKHNTRFLSAYAHNRSILVKEGQSVKAGQVVSRIGASAPGTEMLHFEIRRDGKPEDPLRYLPER